MLQIEPINDVEEEEEDEEEVQQRPLPVVDEEGVGCGDGGGKRLRSLSPDVIVAVGEGAYMQEFECYSVVLCFASSYFDSMLSSGMRESSTKRITFPDKKPEEWKEVYKFMDSRTLRDAKLTKENVKRLIPWFSLFEMTRLLQECDDILKSRVPKTFDVADPAEKGRTVEKAFKMFDLSHKYGLSKCLTASRQAILLILEEAQEHISVWGVEQIMKVVASSPNPREDEYLRKLDDWLQEVLPEGVTLPHDRQTMLQTPHFAYLLHTGLLYKHQKKQVSEFIQTLPDKCFRQFPGGKHTRPYNVDDFTRRKLKKMIWTERATFTGIVDIPADWNVSV